MFIGGLLSPIHSQYRDYELEIVIHKILENFHLILFVVVEFVESVCDKNRAETQSAELSTRR